MQSRRSHQPIIHCALFIIHCSHAAPAAQPVASGRPKKRYLDCGKEARSKPLAPSLCRLAPLARPPQPAKGVLLLPDGRWAAHVVHYGQKMNKPLPRERHKRLRTIGRSGVCLQRRPSVEKRGRFACKPASGARFSEDERRTRETDVRMVLGTFCHQKVQRHRLTESAGRAHPLGRRPATRAARALLRGLRPEHPDRAARFYSAPPGNPMPCLPRTPFSRRSAFFDHFFASDAWIFEN